LKEVRERLLSQAELLRNRPKFYPPLNR
jgi:hypothetical protein